MNEKTPTLSGKTNKKCENMKMICDAYEVFRVVAIVIVVVVVTLQMQLQLIVFACLCQLFLLISENLFTKCNNNNKRNNNKIVERFSA